MKYWSELYDYDEERLEAYYDELIKDHERRRLERDARDCGVILPPEED
jgi:hypothetical protein